MKPITKTLIAVAVLLTNLGIGISQTVSLVSSQQMTINGIPTTAYLFNINSHGIPTRQVIVNQYYRTNSCGAVVLTSGETGTTFYTGAFGNTAVQMVDTLYNSGFEVYDIKWVDSIGYATNAPGKGWHIAM
ncbi:MAG: hypothetical protein IIA88_00345, partial [Bacteroidetes bacterium]|nr:hypothetical protein [Bacteroidota bacterium]